MLHVILLVVSLVMVLAFVFLLFRPYLAMLRRCVCVRQAAFRAWPHSAAL